MQISSREATPYEGPIPRAIEGLFLEIRWQILFCLAPLQPSQPPFFAQPGHEADRRSLAEDPQPVGGVTADFADERRFKESPGYLPHHRRHHGGLPYRAWRIDLGAPRLEYKRLVDSKNHLRQSASSAVDLQPKGKVQRATSSSAPRQAPPSSRKASDFPARFLLIPTTLLAIFQGFLPGLTLPVFKGQK